MIPNPKEQPFMTVTELAAALTISRASAYEAVKTGELPSIRVGRRVLVPVAAVRRLAGLDPTPEVAA